MNQTAEQVGGPGSARPTGRTWRAHVFVGISVDGFLARPDGDLGWLTSRGEVAGDAGYGEFVADVDHVVLGRVTYETVAGFDHWPYGDRTVLVLSRHGLPGDDPRVRVVPSLEAARAALDGARCVYVDGGATIRAFLGAGLVDSLTLSTVPVLIGTGVPLFGPLPADVDLRLEDSRVLPGGMVQTRYAIVRPAGA